MRIHDVLSPEVSQKLSKAFVVVLAISLLYFAEYSKKTTVVQAQEVGPSVVGGRMSTIEEAGPMAKLRNNKMLSSCSTTLIISADTFSNTTEQSTHALSTALHCLLNGSIEADALLNPGYITINPATDNANITYEASRIVIPNVPGVGNTDLAIIITKDAIPLKGDVKAAVIGTQETVPPDLQPVTQGYGVQENLATPGWPYITSITIDENPNNPCAEHNRIISVPSQAHNTHGDSGGFEGYIFRDTEGKTIYKQTGVVSGFCDDSKLEKVGISYESLEAPAMQEELTTIINEGNAVHRYADIPYTDTKPTIVATGEALARYSENRIALNVGSPYSEVVTFNHFQNDETSSVALTNVKLQHRDTSCLNITQTTNALPHRFNIGNNPGVETTFATNNDCLLTPFQSTAERVVQQFELTKTVEDGELKATIDRITYVSIHNPLVIDAGTLSDTPTQLYSEVTNKGSISVTAIKTASEVILTITAPQYLPNLYYTLDDSSVPRAQSEQAINHSQLQWSSDAMLKMSSGELGTTTLVLALPGLTDNTYLPQVSNNSANTESIFLPQLRVTQ